MTSKAQGWAALAAAALGFGLAGCGSSKAPGVILAPSSGQTSQKITNLPSTPTTTPTTPTAATTPTRGPLSKEPKVIPPAGPPPTHLVVKDLIKGVGSVAHKGSSISVNYVGVLYSNGKMFDASWKRHQPFGPFTLGAGAVIPGWDQGLIGMKVGGRRELIIPPSLGYKKVAQPGIPANSTLVFVVDLLAVNG